jgi:hypothetical protein
LRFNLLPQPDVSIIRAAPYVPGVVDGVRRLGGAWRGPIGITPGRIYPRSPPDQAERFIN